MAHDPLEAVLDRLGRAVARIEAAADIEAAPASGLAEAYARLDERHERLRLRVQETIGRLDAIIDAGGDSAGEGGEAAR